MECEHGRSLGIYCRECGPVKDRDSAPLQSGVILPTYDEVERKGERGEILTPVEEFIKCCEPAGQIDEREFRDLLTKLIGWVQGI